MKTKSKYIILFLGIVLTICILTGCKPMIIEIQLYYLPVCVNGEISEFVAKPIWFVFSNIERDTPEGKTQTRRATVYDAVTGETLAWEG